MKARMLLAAAAIAVLVGGAMARRASVPRGSARLGMPPAPVRPSDRFGVNSGLRGPGGPARLRELGVGWIRLPVDWGTIEPRPGQSHWQEVERALAQFQQQGSGLHLMITVRAKSPWAGGIDSAGLAGKRRKGDYTPTPTLPPRDLDTYYRFMKGLATRGRGIVDCWQIENEEESTSWWGGTADQYLTLLKTARRAIRAADPDVTIALGGFTSELTTVAALAARGASGTEIARQMGAKRQGTAPGAEARLRPRVEFMDAVLAGAKDLVDVVDIHLYHDYHTIPWRIQWMRDRMRAHGYEKPIWATEVGGPDSRIEPYTDARQADEVVKRMALALGSGVQKAFWLGLFELQGQGEQFNHLGLLAPGGQKKPAYVVYQGLIRAVDDLPCSPLSGVPNGYGVRFGEGAGARWVLWAERPATYRLPVQTPTVRRVSLTGRTQSLRTNTGAVELSLTDSPILVEPALR